MYRETARSRRKDVISLTQFSLLSPARLPAPALEEYLVKSHVKLSSPRLPGRGQLGALLHIHVYTGCQRNSLIAIMGHLNCGTKNICP